MAFKKNTTTVMYLIYVTQKINKFYNTLFSVFYFHSNLINKRIRTTFYDFIYFSRKKVPNKFVIKRSKPLDLNVAFSLLSIQLQVQEFSQYTVSMKTSSYILILSIYGKNMAYHHHPPTNLSLLCCFSKKNYKRFRETYKENDILKFRLVCYFYFHHNYSALRNIIEQNCRTCSSCSKEKPRNKPTNPPVSAM